MRVAVAGATGALGRRIVAELEGRGADVRALVRDPELSTLAGASQTATIDLSEPHGLAGALTGTDCVVSTVTCFPRPGSESLIDVVDRSGNIALADAAAAVGVPRFVFVSFRPVPFAFPLQDAKRAVEAHLAATIPQAVVLRPGKFMDIWFSPLCGFDPAAGAATIFGSGTAQVTWIAAAEVAEVAARSALGEGPERGTVELGGPEALSQREVVEIYERATRRRFRLDELSAGALERQLAEPRDAFDASLAALMLEADRGAVTDPAEAQRLFPRQPTTVEAFAAAAISRLR